MKNVSRKQLVGILLLLTVLPTLAWLAMWQAGLVGAPGEKLDPPFNFSDRIVTIDVREVDGELRARFDGWDEGELELTGKEFFEEIERRKRELPRLYKWLDVTSLAGVLWVAFGFAGQAVFMGRMIVQWYASEKVRASVVPPLFWWLSLLGSTMLMIYFLWRKEIVGFLGQSTGWLIYVRNLWLIHGKNGRSKEG